MAEVTLEIRAQLSDLVSQMRELVAASNAGAGAEDKLGEAIKRLDTQTEKLVGDVERLTSAQDKATESGKKKKKGDEDQAKAVEDMAKKAVKSIDILGLTGRAQETAAKIAVEYAEILRETKSANSDLQKAWQAGLSPAENSARKLVQLAAGLEDGKEKTDAFKVSTMELGARLEDQIRRQDTNVGSQNKLSRSLSELFDQQNQNNIIIAAGSVAYGEHKKKLDAVEGAMEALHLPGADVVTSFKKIADSMETMGEQSDGAAAALKEGILAGAVVAGIAAVAAGMIYATKTAYEWNQEVSKLGLGLDKLAAQSLTESAKAIDTTAASGKALAVTMMSTVGPAVDTMARGLSVWALQLRDAFQGTQKDLVEYQYQVDGLATKLQAAEKAAAALAKITTIQGKEADALVARIAQEDAFRAKMVQGIRDEQTARLTGVARAKAERDAKLAALDEEYAALKKSYAAGALATFAYEDQRKEIVKSGEIAIADAHKETAKALEEKVKPAYELAAKSAESYAARMQEMSDSTMPPLQAATEEYQARVQELNTAYMAGAVSTQAYRSALGEAAAEFAVAKTAASEYQQVLATIPVASESVTASLAGFNSAAQDGAEAAAKRAKASWGGTFGSIADSAGKLSDLMIKHSKKQGDAAEKAAQIAFRVQQASGIVGVAISTAQAIMMALGTLPPPASYIAAGAAALAGVTQAAVILAQPVPTSAGATGSVSSAAPNAPNLNARTGGRANGSTSPVASVAAGDSVSTDTQGSAMQSHSQRAQDSVVVTDAHYEASAGRRSLSLAPGDVADVRRSGELGKTASSGDSRVEMAIRELIAEQKRLSDRLLYQQHRAEVNSPITRI